MAAHVLKNFAFFLKGYIDEIFYIVMLLYFTMASDDHKHKRSICKSRSSSRPRSKRERLDRSERDQERGRDRERKRHSRRDGTSRRHRSRSRSPRDRRDKMGM